MDIAENGGDIPAPLAHYFDGNGAAAQFTAPTTITTDGTNLFVGDRNYTIRKIVIATGVVTTVAGTSGTAGNTDGTGTSAVLGELHGITTDGTSLFVTSNNINNVRRIQ